MVLRADITSQQFFRDPAAEIARLRALGPVVDIRFPIIGRVWIATTHELSERVLKDGETFTMRQNGGPVAGLRWWMPGAVRALAVSMLTMDEPDHTRLRSIVDEAFRRRAIVEMEPRIQALADELAGELFAQGSPADLVERYSRRLPLAVICELLGLPEADRPKFMEWTSRVSRITGALSLLQLLFSLGPMKRYLEERLDAVRAQGGTGLIAEIVRVEKEGGRISREEMVAMVFLLLGAGTETTTHLIGGSVYELVQKPGAAGLDRGGLEPHQSRGRGIPAVRLARSVHEAALRAQGHRARRRAAEEGREDHGDARRRQSGPGRRGGSGQAGPGAKAQPPHLVRCRHPFLPRPSACAHRGQMRVAGPLQALAETADGGSGRSDPLA